MSKINNYCNNNYLNKDNLIDSNLCNPKPTEVILSCDNGNELVCKARQFSIDLVDNGDLFVNIWKLDGTLIKFNNFAQMKTGFREEEVLGNRWVNTLLHQSDAVELLEMFDKVKKGYIPPSIECELYCKTGNALKIIWSNYIMKDKFNKPFLAVSVGMDVTELKETTNKLKISNSKLKNMNNKLELSHKQLERQLVEQKKIKESIYRMAYYDELTGLLNRTMFLKELSLELTLAKKSGGKVALLFMDIDNFKNINDTLGHNNGDILLKVIGDNIGSLTNEDFIAARFGGDEFAILIKNIKSKEDIQNACTKVIKEFKRPINIKNREFNITISIGAAMYSDDIQDEYTLLKNADIAMYYSKEHGRNEFALYNNDMKLQVLEKLELENGLKNALKNNEFCIYYQPQIAIDKNEIVGVEALVRWVHPVKGIISPIKFIKVAEETDIIIQMGELVLLKACEQFTEWKRNGIELKRLAVNVSARQFEQSNFTAIIKKIIEETNMNGEYLELEITESIAMKNLDYTINVINELKKLNIKVSLDDFGTGYSSLNYLMRLPINTLKIDKSFIENIKLNSNKEIIAKTIITLARNMNLDVIAEGVETYEQLEFLKKNKCDIAQGYLFSEPIPEDNFIKMIKNKIIHW
ncbi:sensor domain-containing protein [Candidatus Clostridium stratigraminis]|uniref:EAL domain-containing protein n=1 Tax=Candidatus Clostridium stratigraminis TaxID=3381661 RepID=A0ABW8SZQ0_9CLOT